jgi:EmrB/QacA subfamily drug resistance transporter
MSPATIHRRRWWTLGVLSLSLLIISLDNTILNVALPTLSDDLGATSSQLQWIVDIYLLVFAGLLLTAGSLGDRYGRRRSLRIGLVIFGLGSIAATFSGSATELIVSRAVMGLGGAFIMPSTLSVLTHVFPEEERARAIGIWAAVSGLGIVIGPIAGGALLEHFAWGSVFLINIPFVIAALALSGSLVPESKDPEHAWLDPVGAGLSIAGLGTLLWAIIEAPERGWTNPAIIGALGVAAVVLALFAVWELRSRHPMLDVRLFRLRAFTGAAGAISLVFFALMGTIYFLTQYLQEVLGYDAFGAGVRITPVAVGLMIAAPSSTKIAARVGNRVVVATGLTVVAGALLLLSTASDTSGYGLVAATLLILGFGMGTAMAPATESIMSSLPAEHAGVGSAMNDTLRQVGGALGVAILGSILASNYGPDMETATHGLPANAASAAQDSVGAANAVAHHVGGDTGQALAGAAHHAFISAMDTTVLIAAGFALAGALFAAIVLPSRKPARATVVPIADARREPVAVEVAAA